MQYLIRRTLSDELMHYGIKGQKWGLRRYENKDGTLTEEGKKRYYKPRDPAERKQKLYELNKRISDKYLPLYEKNSKDHPYKLNGKNEEYWKGWKNIFEAEQKERDEVKDQYIKEYFTEEGQKIFAMAKTALDEGWKIWQKQHHDGKDSVGQMKIRDLLTGFEAAVKAFPEFELEEAYNSDEFLELAWSNIVDMDNMKIQGEKFIADYLQQKAKAHLEGMKEMFKNTIYADLVNE